MHDNPTSVAIRRFLHLVLDGTAPTDAMPARALDELALAYHETPDGVPDDDDRTPPKSDYQVMYSRLAARFPRYGHYPVVNPLGSLDTEPILWDAIDDLADLCCDLRATLWRFEHLGPDDAHWHFRLGYQIHWGLHLRQLAQYLHAKISSEIPDSW